MASGKERLVERTVAEGGAPAGGKAIIAKVGL